LQVLFQADVRQQPVDEAIRNFYETLYSNETQETPGEEQMPPRPPRDEFMETLARGTFERRGSIDEQIVQRSAHWRIERMPVADRNILRLAIFEMQVVETPAAVVIDEALELGRQFSGPDSVGFLNGILDAVRKAPGSAAKS
jgi:N utilization substance protein B